MNEQNTKRLLEAGEDILAGPHVLQIEDGWTDTLVSLFKLAKHHLGRWREVQGIKEKLLAKGEDLSKYEWIAEYFRSNPTDPLTTFKIVQIKEKFGGLRVYYEGGADPFIDGLISMAEAVCWRTCYFCAKPGKVCSRNYWLCVACPDCDADLESRNSEARG
jgi:hypothetical protein